MRWLRLLLVALAGLLAFFQYRLWVGEGGSRSVARLDRQVQQQTRENAGLQQRNDALAAEVEDLKSRYRAGRVGDVEVKAKLAAAINARLEPIRARRAAALARPDYLRDVLFAGSARARAVARETMERVRAAVNLRY